MSQDPIQPNEQVQKMGAIMKGQLVEGEHGVRTLADGWFEKTLEGTELSLDDFKKTQNHRDLVLEGTALALGQNGIEAFKQDKNLETVSVEGKIHKDEFAGVFHRQKNLPDGNGGMKPRHGVLTMSYKANGQQGSKGQLKKVKQHLCEEALKVLNG